MRGRIIFFALMLATAAAGGAGWARAQQASPPTLSGEQFVNENVTVTGTCNPNGTSTISSTSSGVAAGPYSGTYTETVTATVGPQVPTGAPGVSEGPVTSLTATFSIDSPIGRVTGTKQLSNPSGDPSFGLGRCDDFLKRFNAVARYTAEIQTPDGRRFTDRGTTNVSIGRFSSQAPPAGVFVETFRSELLAPVPALVGPPTDKEQCKDGGWMRFNNPAFRNQGDCVSFVQTGGRNPAASPRP